MPLQRKLLASYEIDPEKDNAYVDTDPIIGGSQPGDAP